jgi:hypothetical protein
VRSGEVGPHGIANTTRPTNSCGRRGDGNFQAKLLGADWVTVLEESSVAIRPLDTRLAIDAPFSRTSQLEPSFACSDGALAAGRSIGSLKYKHHFGLDCFSMRREH